MKRQSGFSLVEIMVVVAIIAVVTAIALPSYRDYIIKSRLTEAFSSLASAHASASSSGPITEPMRASVRRRGCLPIRPTSPLSCQMTLHRRSPLPPRRPLIRSAARSTPSTRTGIGQPQVLRRRGVAVLPQPAGSTGRAERACSNPHGVGRSPTTAPATALATASCASARWRLLSGRGHGLAGHTGGFAGDRRTSHVRDDQEFQAGFNGGFLYQRPQARAQWCHPEKCRCAVCDDRQCQWPVRLDG